MLEVRDNLQESVSCYHVGSRDWTQVMRLGGKRLYPVSYLAGLFIQDIGLVCDLGSNDFPALASWLASAI